MIEVLREHFKVVEWKDGCVWKTKSLGLKWMDRDAIPESKDDIYVSPSTKVPQPWIRTKA